MQLKTLVRWSGTEQWKTVFPGLFAVNANKTVIFFARMQDMHRAKVMPNAVCRSMQDHLEGRPMKVREQRKHRVREKRSRKLSSELLALMRGVWRNRKKTQNTSDVNTAPNSETVARRAPRVSSNDKNSITFGIHWLWSSFDQRSTGQGKHSAESKNERRHENSLKWKRIKASFLWINIFCYFWGLELTAGIADLSSSTGNAGETA